VDYPDWSYADFKHIRYTFLEFWPQELTALAAPHFQISLTLKEAQTLISTPCLWRTHLVVSDPVALHSLADKLEFYLNKFHEGCFIRLGSRSPKDSPLFKSYNGCIRNAITAIKILQTSLRVHADIQRCLLFEYPPSLFFRKWITIEPWQEIRCFMLNRQLVGITQLDCINYGRHGQLVRQADNIEKTIREFFKLFSSCCHLETVVFDVILMFDINASDQFNVLLNDLNPWGNKTNPGLFRWDIKEDFDGSFRYV